MSKIKVVAATGLVVLAGVLGALGAGNEAQAACATYWEMGEKSVSFCGGTLEDGTFTAKLEGNDASGYVSTVILKDYKGPAFVPRTYGTGFEVKKFIVELEGLSEVTLEDFEQLYMGKVEYELKGEGRLVVRTSSGASEGSDGSLGASDGALVGSTEDQTKCDAFGAEDAATWIAVRVGIVGGTVAVIAAVAFGVVKLVQEVKKSKKA